MNIRTIHPIGSTLLSAAITDVVATVATLTLGAVAAVLAVVFAAVPAPSSTATTTAVIAANTASFLNPVGTPKSIHSFTPSAIIAANCPRTVNVLLPFDSATASTTPTIAPITAT